MWPQLIKKTVYWFNRLLSVSGNYLLSFYPATSLHVDLRTHTFFTTCTSSSATTRHYCCCHDHQCVERPQRHSTRSVLEMQLHAICRGCEYFPCCELIAATWNDKTACKRHVISACLFTFGLCLYWAQFLKLLTLIFTTYVQKRTHIHWDAAVVAGQHFCCDILYHILSWRINFALFLTVWFVPINTSLNYTVHKDNSFLFFFPEIMLYAFA